MTSTSIHAIGDNKFSIDIRDTGNAGLVSIKCGVDEILVFLHDGMIDRALHDIDTAIRAFLDNRK